MKSKSHILAQIKSTVNDCEPGAVVLLFGSHARGDADQHSDFDVLIITSAAYPQAEKAGKTALLSRSLVKATGYPIDVLMTTKYEFEQKSELPGHVFRTAIREGMFL